MFPGPRTAWDNWKHCSGTRGSYGTQGHGHKLGTAKYRGNAVLKLGTNGDTVPDLRTARERIEYNSVSRDNIHIVSEPAHYCSSTLVNCKTYSSMAWDKVKYSDKWKSVLKL